MDMGMVEQILPPCVQDGEESDFCTQMLRIGGDDAQRLGCCTKKNVVDDLLVIKGDGGDLFWQREDNVKIGGVEHLGLAVLNPLGANQRLTLTTVPVSAGVVPDALVAALVTLFHVATESGSPAGLDRAHDATLGAG